MLDEIVPFSESLLVTLFSRKENTVQNVSLVVPVAVHFNMELGFVILYFITAHTLYMSVYLFEI